MKRYYVLSLAVTLVAANGFAQGQDLKPGLTRPASATVNGDSGMWTLPTAEILPNDNGMKNYSFSFHRDNADFDAGSTDVSHLTIAASRGMTNWLEVFGSWRAQTRIDRDGVALPGGNAPLFHGSPGGGIVSEFPFVNSGWQAARGDVLIGAKIGVLSEADQDDVALSIRPSIKLAVGADEEGVSTGANDYVVDVVVSRALTPDLDVTGVAGFQLRGDPDDLDLPNGLRWGAGATWPRKPVFMTFEVYGEKYLRDSIMAAASAGVQIVTAAPAVNPQLSPINVVAGVTWRSRNGISVRGAVRWNANTPNVTATSRLGLHVGLGFHHGVRAFQH